MKEKTYKVIIGIQGHVVFDNIEAQSAEKAIEACSSKIKNDGVYNELTVKWASYDFNGIDTAIGYLNDDVEVVVK